jgi:hypothetical protein
MPFRVRSLFAATLLLVAAACSHGPVETPPNRPPSPTVPNQPANVGRVVLRFDSREAFRGLVARLQLEAFDVQGQRMNSNLATFTSSNPRVAASDGWELVQAPQPNASTVTEISHHIAMLDTGAVTFRVRLGDVTDSMTVNVRPLPSAVNVLAVDSFFVIEFGACAGCGTWSYAPLLKLREPTGTVFADVIGVEFRVPNISSGYCTTSGMHFSSGLSAHVNYIDPYPYANDMMFWSLSPLPDGVATARVVVRDHTGNYGLIVATGLIQRRVTNPVFPATTVFPVSWSCSSRTLGP